jgi:hypothetical protein
VSDLQSRIAAGKADPVTDGQKARAARIRVKFDQKNGLETPNWIKAASKNVD